MNRRDFIKATAWACGGTAFAWRYAEAFWPVHPIGGVGVTSWADWDETDLTLATDNIFVVLYHNTVAGSNETGSGGGLSGADLIVTQVGNVAGATGDPASRALDDSDDGFNCTVGLTDTLLKSQTTWQLIMKVIDPVGTGQLIYLFETNNSIEIYLNATENIDGKIETNGVARVNAATTNGMAAATPYYVFCGTDGSSSYIGFKATTKPTKWSDFAANDRVSNADAGAFLQSFSTLALASLAGTPVGGSVYFSAMGTGAPFINLAA